jgi:S1-C subfamily serine protease
MKKILLIFVITSLQSLCLGQTPSDMLERTLPGVVTVAVNEISPVKKVMGAASGSDRFDKAYERVLDLSDAKGSGSGFVIKRGGRFLIVTNAHVVEMAQPDAIFAYSINQTRYKMKVFGGDSFYDIALLEFVEPAQPGPEITPIEFRTDDPRIGETVYALGNPLGEYPYSVSQGIVGGRNRLLGGLTGRIGYLQHSASIVWGNSGGPLVDSAGRVAGVNTRIEITDHGQAFLISQLNFALQASTAVRVIDALLANHGRLNRAYLGLELTQTVPVNKFRKSVAIEAVIESVVPGGPAAPLERFKGYRVDRIGSQSVRNLDEAMAAIEALAPGQTVEFEVTKGASTQTVEIRTGSLTEENYAALANHVIGSRSGFQVAQQDGRVYLQRQSEPGTQAMSSMKMRPVSSGAQQSYGQTPRVIGIVAVGLVPQRRSDQEEADPLLYRVNTLVDLGVAMRLLFMDGLVDLVVVSPNATEPSVVRWTLSSDSNVLVRMLIS